MPYNYLLNGSIRASSGIDTKNSILIFDEAHNIEKIAEDGCSFDISLFNYRKYKFYFKELRKHHPEGPSLDPDSLAFEDLMINFENYMADFKKKLEDELKEKNKRERQAHQKLSDYKDVYKIYEGREIFRICKEKMKSRPFLLILG